MGKAGQVLGNLLLYLFLLWLLYNSTIKEWDPWFAAIVAFVLVLSLVISMIPALHAKATSPGEYPYDD
jgi:hypothetical protein